MSPDEGSSPSTTTYTGLRKNRLSLKGSRTLVAGIRGARFDLIKDVGHVWNLEAPDQFTQTVDDFIQSSSA